VGVRALPASQVEDDVFSSIATIFEVEFPAKYAEKTVHIADEELFAACQKAPHLIVIGESGKRLTSREGSVSKVKLDNNGNAFVIVLGDSSCAEGTSLIEADLESTPFLTLTSEFTVLSPRVTEF
jgi:23S rRNA pseudoU1915 N3-methylase RlmH